MASFSNIERAALRYAIESAIERWRDELDDPPAWLYSPDDVKETARAARDLVLTRSAQQEERVIVLGWAHDPRCLVARYPNSGTWETSGFPWCTCPTGSTASLAKRQTED